MKIELIQRDVFYNNGITNIFWATLKEYDEEYNEMENIYKVDVDGVSLNLKRLSLIIEGEEENIKNWYKRVSEFLINTGLTKTKRLVYDGESKEFKEGYSFIRRPFAVRTWGSSVNSKLIAGPSIVKKFCEGDISKALNIYEERTGKTLKELDKEGVFKKNWYKEGIYIPIDEQVVIDNLMKNRYSFQKATDDTCEICGSPYVLDNKREKYKRDSAVIPTVIGLNYSGFKDLMVNNKNIICAFCDLVLRYCFFWSFYSKSLVLLFDVPDLVELFNLKTYLNISIESSIEKDKNSNLNTSFRLSSVERILLALIIEVFKRIQIEGSSKDLEIILKERSNILRVYGIFFAEEGISCLIEYHKLTRFLEFLSNIKNYKAISEPFEKGRFSLTKGQNKDIYEKEFLRKFLDFREVAPILKEVAYLKIKENIYQNPFLKDFEDMLIIYYQFVEEVRKMSKEDLEFLRKFGWVIGTLAQTMGNKGDKGIFYELRDAKKIEHIEKVLRDFSFKLLRNEDEIRQKDNFVQAALTFYTSKDKDFISLLEKTSSEWNKIRDLVSFFAVNSFLKGGKEYNE